MFGHNALNYANLGSLVLGAELKNSEHPPKFPKTILQIIMSLSPLMQVMFHIFPKVERK